MRSWFLLWALVIACVAFAVTFAIRLDARTPIGVSADPCANQGGPLGRWCI